MGLMFNGKPLPAKIGLEGWSVSTPKLTQRTVDVPDRRGVIYTGSKLGNRAISFSMALLADSGAEAVELQRQLCEWVLSDAPAPLVLPNREGQYILAQCDAFPAPDMGQWWETFDVNFICPAPDFIDAFPHRQALDSDLVVDGHWVMDFVTGGSLSAPVRLSVTLGASVSNLNFFIDDHVIALRGTSEAGALVIDTETGAVTLEGVDVTYAATLASDLAFALAPGKHRLGWPQSAQLTGALEWRERWV